MSQVLDLAKFTFSAEELRAVNEMLYDDIVKSPEITSIATMYPNIVYNKEIGFIGRGGLVGVAGQGCDPVAQAFAIATRKVTWEPKVWEIRIEQCAKDLEATAALYSLQTGIKYFDFTSADYMNIVKTVLFESIKEFVIRLFWFNDVDADTIANGGSLTNGTDKDYFNIIDGWFKQLSTQVTANTKQRITITENAGATYDAQELLADNIIGYFKALKRKAPVTLRNQTDGMILCTQSMYDAYYDALQSTGKSLESMYTNLIEGITTLKIDNTPIVPIAVWDYILSTYYNTGVKVINPHRAVYISRKMLACGADSEGSFGEMDVFFDKKSRKVIIDSYGKADAKLLAPDLLMYAI